MEGFIKYAYFFALIVMCSSKDLHLKEEHETLKDNVNGLVDIFKTNEMFDLEEQDRYARHARTLHTVTETALQHLMNEINKKYPENKKGKNATMPKIIRKLKSKLRKHIKKNKNGKRKKVSNGHPKGHAKPIDTTTAKIN